MEQSKSVNEEDWDIIISPKTRWFEVSFKEIWNYRDLLFLFVRRDFVSIYKQTVLGPLWFFIQPVFSALVFTVIFGRVANIPTDGIPPLLFYLAGLTAWNYFSDCLNKTSNTFVSNANIFGKVYFPRLIVPLSIVVSNLFKFLIQFSLFLVFLIYYSIKNEHVYFNSWIILTPVLLLIMGGMGLGFGIIISSLTTKYRDLQNLVGFGVQLLMYATPIVYPLSLLSGKMRILAILNPMTHVIETFKYAFLGAGTINLLYLAYSIVFMFAVLSAGLLLFNKVEKAFMDTV